VERPEILHENSVETIDTGKVLALGGKRIARGGCLRKILVIVECHETVPDAVRVALSPRVEALAGEVLLGALSEALSRFRDTRRAEGERIEGQFRQALESLRALKTEADVGAVGQVASSAERLNLRIQQLGVQVDPVRMEQEVALLAQRADVQEELVRLDAHRQAMENLLEADGADLGRRLDHLLQEMQREVSTLLAKSDAYALTQTGLRMRLVVEQMREQAQNVA